MNRIKLTETTEDLLRTFRRHRIHIDAVCNGNGTCGRCKLRFVDHAPEVTDQERTLLSVDEIRNGWRLACRHGAKAGTLIELPDEKTFSILGAAVDHFDIDQTDDVMRIAIDIGTTTIVILVIDGSGKVLDEVRFMNPQRIYGADVLSRIQYDLETESGANHRTLLAQLEPTLQSIGSRHPGKVFKIGITGNPTMTHFLMGEPVAPIIQIPYSCAVKETRHYAVSALFPSLVMKGTAILYPPISAYVGADIVTGLVDLDFFRRTGSHLFLDLGTNGELVLLKDGIAYATSTAAGPAFEGGSLSCGCGSIDGAICDVYRMPDGTLGFDTIAKADPIGICGSGYIALLSEILGHEMEDNGYLSEPIRLTPTIVLTQQDVRMFQLAKSAIRTGIEILLKKTETDPKTIERFELSGGFGSGLALHAAFRIGLFPQALKDKCHINGNTALKGCAKLLFESTEHPLFDPSRIVAVELANEPSLMDQFTENLFFNQT